ncbi:hypothetical protein [Saccharibacillus kuerlensis]|uniref:Uncharacterized protein n=1 Tax=Saccharibacillus kuerlensis TaxID=459527 RepID=A0ABQ2KV57_9BACL|nr:hypothetical protein [Saccharibacillus kuerlensis]GGN94241.1 hypothetical protein GCM10010969_08780 [Saccharibacillus kuerlensis]
MDHKSNEHEDRKSIEPERTSRKKTDSRGQASEPVTRRPIKVLSTSLGLALIANTALVPAGALASNTSSGSTEPKLVEWSSDEVKQYFDPAIDWSLPITQEDLQEQEQTAPPSSENGDGTTVVNNYYGGYGSGFGWSDLLLYHFLFNNAGVYSSRGWYNNRGGYYAGTNRPYTPRSYNSGSFQNRPVAGSSVRPKTSNSTGKITRRSTSAGSGSVGGRSSGLSSSGSNSSGSKSGGFFGG